MIEATNSVLSNASVTKVVTQQQSTARSLTANPQRVQEAAVRAPYVSPYLSIDRSSNRAVLQIRDSETGDVLRQYPTESQLRAYRQAQEAADRDDRVERVFTPPSGNTEGVPQISEPTADVTTTTGIETEA
jgi:uncharacterized FlaG/YvyC family protein